MRMSVNKYSGSRTVAEQPADLMSTFKIFNRNQKKITLKHRPVIGFKEKVHALFTVLQQKGIINFSPPKFNCIIDFAICIPELLTQLDGFIQAGMIDKKTTQWPDFENIIGTCQRKIKMVKVYLVKKDFTHLYNTFLLEGRIPEEVFDEIGIVEDRNLDGKVYYRCSLADCH